MGLIATYQEVISTEDFDIQEAAEALAAAANKPIDTNVVTTVNGLLGIELDPEIDDAIAAAAAELQAPEAVEEEGGNPVQ